MESPGCRAAQAPASCRSRTSTTTRRNIDQVTLAARHADSSAPGSPAATRQAAGAGAGPSTTEARRRRPRCPGRRRPRSIAHSCPSSQTRWPSPPARSSDRRMRSKRQRGRRRRSPASKSRPRADGSSSQCAPDGYRPDWIRSTPPPSTAPINLRRAQTAQSAPVATRSSTQSHEQRARSAYVATPAESADKRIRSRRGYRQRLDWQLAVKAGRTCALESALPVRTHLCALASGTRIGLPRGGGRAVRAGARPHCAMRWAGGDHETMFVDPWAVRRGLGARPKPVSGRAERVVADPK